jgi:hypothetical protein
MCGKCPAVWEHCEQSRILAGGATSVSERPKVVRHDALLREILLVNEVRLVEMVR